MITTKKEMDHIDKEIIQMAGDGKTAKEIARELKASPRSIEYRIASMKKYYDCKSLPQLLIKLSKMSESSVSQ